MMKVEKALANPNAPTVVWLSGSACTGCTMSLLNSVFYTTVDDLLLNRINLTYLDTAMATAGAYFGNTPYAGANSIAEAAKVLTSGKKFVLVVEGAIPTATPPGSTTAGDYCRIGDLTVGDGTGPETVLANVDRFAKDANCIAVLAVGTCSSYGGIPGAQGNVCGAKGVAFSGTKIGGAIFTNAPSGKVVNVQLKNNSGVLQAGSGYPAYDDDAVTFSPAGAHADVYSDMSTVVSLDVTALTVTGLSTVPTVVIAPPPVGPGAKQAYASAVINTSGSITKFNVTDPGFGYASGTAVVTIKVGTTTVDTTTAAIGAGAITKIVVTAGGSYTSAPDVTSLGTGSSAAAFATVTVTKGDVKARTGDAAKLINISGCPPHPDWIVGTIAHILDTGTLPAVNSNYQPVDYGYKEYQCNAGPCPWRYNNSASKPDENTRYPVGDSKNLGKNKWTGLGGNAVGCLGILGCKGRKTKADCSRRRWNSDAAENYGVNWCVGSRAGCHGCTEPAFPDKVGKFFTFV